MRKEGSQHYRRILCVRPDNMGDLLMSSPAIAALKESFGAQITILTSSMGEKIVPFIPQIDDSIIIDFPWVKTESNITHNMSDWVDLLRDRKFDAAFIFTVFSQNPLPSAMVCYLAGIPDIYAYCRENPYGLVNHWIPDDEPYIQIRHQVLRDLRLVEEAGACTGDPHIRIQYDSTPDEFHSKLSAAGINMEEPFLVVHAGVSEEKRQFPTDRWVSLCREISRRYGYQLLFTGVSGEYQLADEIIRSVDGVNCFNLAGKLSLNDFILCVARAALVVSVNTSTTHIAAAVQTPVVVLYAATNPQHIPWMVPSKVIYFPVKEQLRSNNQVLRYVAEHAMPAVSDYPTIEAIIEACDTLLQPIATK